jgi:hypothetical protein
MALDDFLESEVAVAAAVAAAVFSPRVRGVLRKGAVYGVAGVLVAGDAVGSFARGVGRGAQNAASTTADAAGNAVAATTDAAGTAAGVAGGVSGSAASAVTDTTESAANATPATPEAAADELAAVAQGTTDGTTTTGRRSRRAHTEQTEDGPHE